MNSAPVTPSVVPSSAMPAVTFPAPPMEPYVANNGNEDTSHEGRLLEPMAQAPPTKPLLMRTQTDLVSDQKHTAKLKRYSTHTAKIDGHVLIAMLFKAYMIDSKGFSHMMDFISNDVTLLYI